MMGTRPPAVSIVRSIDAQPLVMRQRRRLAGGAAGHKKVDARLNLPAHQFAQGRFIQAAILFEGSDESGAATTQFHWRRIIVWHQNLKEQTLKLLAVSP